MPHFTMEKSRISNEVGASVFAILTALSVLFLAVWFLGDRGSPNFKAGSIFANDTSEVDKLSAKLTEAKAAQEKETERRTELAAQAKANDSDKVETEGN